MIGFKKTLIIIILLAGSFILTKCMKKADAKPDPRGRMFAGSAACRQCHQSVSDSFIKSAHFNSTRPGTDKKLSAFFKASQSQFEFGDSSYIKAEERNGNLFQVLYVNGKEVSAYKADIIFGCRNAMTFAYWKDEQIFELPLSFYTSVNSWGTSPGFSNKIPHFTRSIDAECFDCHSSSLQLKANESIGTLQPKLDTGSIIYGIDCERCHGPAMNHVNYHIAYPEEKAAKYMVRNASLTHQQNLDACAVCHSGNDQKKIQSRFAFSMGDTLDHFFYAKNSNTKRI